MPTIFSKKVIAIAVTFLLITILFFVSCQKEVSGIGGTATLPDLSTKINSSITGFVTNDNNEAVIGATVTAGSSIASTDRYGYFELKNASVVKDAAVVTVSQPGYFNAIKTYIATVNKSAFFRIQLINKVITGSIDAATGGTVTLNNGLSVLIPSNAVINKATGVAYTGTVNIATHWLDPTSPRLNSFMPGDLRGITTAGSIKMLATYGMAAVELTGASGELLQIATGKKATLTFPVPTGISAKAPASIPLWYFDEIMGLWKQQGSAAKTGNTYVGDVSHFSYWNCDWPFADAVSFSCTVVDANGQSLPNVSIDIYYTNADTVTNFTGCHGYTDSSGYLSGAIPANAHLKIEVNNYYGGCNSPYSQLFSTTNNSIAFGNIVISGQFTSFVTGNVTTCNNAPVTNGYVVYYQNDYPSRVSINNAGSFSFTTFRCANNPVINLIAQDINAQQQSNLTPFTLVAGNNNIGTLAACGTITSYVNYTLDGSSYSLTVPSQLYQGIDPQVNPDKEMIIAYGDISGGTTNFDFTYSGIGVNSHQQLLHFSSTSLSDSLTSITTPIAVNITEYGAVNQFMAGNFSGILTGAPPANIQHTVTCNFRLKRQY